MNVVRATGARLTAPADLSAAEREHWIAIVDSLPADFFRPSDAHLLRSYCIASAFYTMAADEMKRDGITIVDAASGRSRPHPAATILTSQASAMAQMAVKLRLCPSSRTTSARAETKAKASVAAAKRPWQSAG
jgi:P27 family predicted phage terminase small subunit